MILSGTSVLIFNKWAGYDLQSGTSVPNILLVILLTQNSLVLNALHEWETLKWYEDKDKSFLWNNDLGFLRRTLFPRKFQAEYGKLYSFEQ